MKKHITLLAFVAVATLFLTSCGKRCWCYEYYSTGVNETETYADEGASCSSLSTLTRTCVEDAERMDASQLAYKK